MNNKIEIQLTKHIHANFASVCSEDVWLIRVMKLPIQPFVGLTIVDNHFKFEETIKEITYNYKKDVVTCYVEDDKELYDKGLKSDNFMRINEKRLTEIVKEYGKVGWVVKKQEVKEKT